MRDAGNVEKLAEVLARLYPDPRCALHFSNPLQLLVATILSAQCTDVRVNLVTPALFRKYPSARHFAQASLPELEQMVRPTGFFRNKARHIQRCCQAIVKDHGGQVPNTIEALTALPGVARKTANVVLGSAFGVAAGVVVDTHVLRLARRLGLTMAQQPEKVEKDLMAIVPPPDWIRFSHWLILHGRSICQARKPKCEACPLLPSCPRIGVP